VFLGFFALVFVTFADRGAPANATNILERAQFRITFKDLSNCQQPLPVLHSLTLSDFLQRASFEEGS
jgi:hypothetical protein